MTGVEPIKASTIKQFEWCPVEAFIEHLKEVGDERVTATSKSSEALRAGEKLHEGTFGLRVVEQEEDTGREILEKMKHERVTAINHGQYQIQGAPDEVIVDGDSVRVTDMKATGWDSKSAYREHQLPPAAFQVRIYSWMLSHVPNIAVKNPKVVIKQRKNDTAVDWFTEEIEYDRSETEKKSSRFFPSLRPPRNFQSSS